MNRFLIVISITALIAFTILANSIEPGAPDFDRLAVMASGTMAIGIGMLVFGFVMMTNASTAQDKGINQGMIMFGLYVGTFGLGIYPFAPQKWIMVPIALALSAATARIVVRSAVGKETDLAAYGPAFLAMATCLASVWALAAGWNWYQAIGFMLVGLLVAAFNTNASRIQGAMPVTN